MMSLLRRPSSRRLWRIERVAEILERFFHWDNRLTAELLGKLARCDTRGPREAVWLTVTAP
jgi:hypothetical protein